jgi:hypothetical protein
MKLSKGKLLLLLTIIYLVFSTPWYLPKGIEHRIAGIPAWAFAVPFVTCGLGYLTTYVAYKLER